MACSRKTNSLIGKNLLLLSMRISKSWLWRGRTFRLFTYSELLRLLIVKLEDYYKEQVYNYSHYHSL